MRRLKYIEAYVTDENIRWGNHKDPCSCLQDSKIYTLHSEEIHSWHTKIFLEDGEKVLGPFNSVWFEEVEG